MTAANDSVFRQRNCLLLAVLPLLFSFLLSSCSPGPAPEPVNEAQSDNETAETPTDTDTGTATDAAEDGAANKAVPILGTVKDFVLTDQFARPYGSQEMLGQMSVAHFFFTSCTATCPQQMAVMSELSDWLDGQEFHNYSTLVNITVDPEQDTPETLQQYSKHWTDDNERRWAFLTGDKSAIRELAEDQFHLPVATDRGTDPLMGIAHSSKLTLIDPIGRIRGYYDALDAADVEKLKRDALAVWSEQLPFLAEILDPPWLEIRQQAQLETRSEIHVDADFQFVDRQRESRLRFLHRIVDDAAINYKGVHYDHGNGLALGDVDGDGLQDLYFTNQIGSNELWRNVGDGTFENITENAGVGLADRVCVSASFVDIDNDADLDLYVTSVREGNVLFRNDGTGQFEDVTEDSGLGYQGHSSGAVFFDYDRDGKLDLFLCNVGVYTTDEQGRDGYWVGFKDAFSGHLKPERTEVSRLYHNVDGLRFEDVTESMGLNEGSWTGDAAIIDANQDGWLDLYVLDMQGNDEYYENQQGTGFQKLSRDIFPKTPWGAMGVAVFDFENDADLDIFVTDMHSDMSKDILADLRSEASLHTFFHEEKIKATMQLPESLLKSEGASIFGNAFFRNDGDGQFVEVSDEIGAENYWPWGLSIGDLNADGFEDAFLASSMNFPYRYAVNSILLNERGQRFVDAEFILGAEPRINEMTAQPWFVLNCDEETAEDSLMKKVCAGRTGDVVVWGSLGTRSSVIFDYDNDGDLDIITSEFHNVPMVLTSDLAQRKTPHFVKLQLQGTRSNRQAIGTQLTIKTGEQTLFRFYDGKTGYLSQGAPELYVGLGSAEQVDEIQITWPSGQQQTIAGPVPSGETLTITESE